MTINQVRRELRQQQSMSASLMAVSNDYDELLKGVI